jgi:hypothetical protein
MLRAALALAVSATFATPPSAVGEDAVPLAFDRLQAPAPRGKLVAPDVEALAGRRVRVVGHMVNMEEPPRAAFYLAPRPVEQDESGGGTGDLPPRAVRVEVRGFEGEVPWIAGPLEVEGRLELGRAEDDGGRVSWIRVVVEPEKAAERESGPAENAAPEVPSRSRDGVSKP